MRHQKKIALEINAFSAPIVDVALARVGYLHPDWQFRADESKLTATIPSTECPDIVLREIRYAIYREKILAETMDMRRELLRMVARP